MSHQHNKQFNTYKEGLDIKFLRKSYIEHGKTLEEADKQGSTWTESFNLNMPDM